MNDDPWIGSEPGFAEWRQELMRLWHRAKKRKLVVVIVALCMAGAVVLVRWRKQQSFAASVTFRVTEGDSSAGPLTRLAPPPTKELREYVTSIALSSGKVVEVMKQHGIRNKMVEADPVKAVQLFREDLEVEVSRNYFIEEWQANKSARLTMTYSAGTAQEAQAVVNDLAELVVADEARRRQAQVNAAVASADKTVSVVQREVDARQTRLAQLEQALTTASAAQKTLIGVEMNNLRAELPQALERLKTAENTRGDLQLSLLAEEQSLSVRFDKVDESIEAVVRDATPAGLALLGLLIFCLSLPIAVMAVGAFDRRVYDLDDVGRLGLIPVGHVPPFRGDGLGTLRQRRANE
jgi:hypothetical protein